jgi:hypothetical protein
VLFSCASALGVIFNSYAKPPEATRFHVNFDCQVNSDGSTTSFDTQNESRHSSWGDLF